MRLFCVLQVMNEPGLDDADIRVHRFASVNRNRGDERVQTQITGEFFVIELPLLDNSDIENISKYKQIQFSMKLGNGQTNNIKMSSVSFYQTPSSHETSSGPCQGKSHRT